MIILSVDKQAEIFLFSLLLGICAGVIYDAVKILRLIFPHKKIAASIEDGIYWIVCVFAVFSLMLKNNSGEIRLFSMFAFFGAMIVYSLTLSRLIMAVSEKIVFCIKWTVKLFLEIILTPFKILWLIFRRPVKYVDLNIKKTRGKLLILIKKYVKIYGITIREHIKLILK